MSANITQNAAEWLSLFNKKHGYSSSVQLTPNSSKDAIAGSYSVNLLIEI